MDRITINEYPCFLVKATKEQKRKFYELVEDDNLLEAYIVYMHPKKDFTSPNTKDIGVVWQGMYGWNTVPFAGDIGHNGFDTVTEAALDLIETYMEMME